MIRNALPSFVTSLGLLTGCLAVAYASTGNLYAAGILILMASLFDFADGLLARLLNSISEFGKQLDSLADVVSFGLAPAMILRKLMELSLTGDRGSPQMAAGSSEGIDVLLVNAPFLIVVFSALRLARFNLDRDQSRSFKGLATPANAIWVTGLGFMAESSRFVLSGGQAANPWFYLAFTALSCFLLVSNIRMFSLKFHSYGMQENFIRYFFLTVSVVLLLVKGLPALTWIIVCYIALSLLNHYIIRQT
jgi:CDP-diacylglycerol--serine O-phosphatidyltransferase